MLAGLGLGAFFKESAAYAAELADQANQIGVSVERLQGFNKVFSEAGSSPEDVSKAFIELNNNTIEALAGNEKAQASFKALGVSMHDIVQNADKPDELMLKLSEGFGKAENKGLALKAVTELLGRSAKKMGGNFADAAAGVRDFDSSMVKLTTSEAKANDQMTEWFAGQWRNLLARGGKLTAAGWNAAKTLTSGDQWKHNTFGQQSAEKSMAPFEPKQGPDPLTGMTEYQRGLVAGGMDPAQARAMTPGRGEAEMTPRETTEQAQKHAEQNAREALRVGEERKRAEMARNANSFTRRRGLEANKQDILDLQKRLARGMAPADAAPLQTELAGRLNERRATLREQNLMTPEQRREQRREEGRIERADTKAQRQMDREAKNQMKGGSEVERKRDDNMKGAGTDLEAQITKIVDEAAKMTKACESIATAFENVFPK